MSAEAARLLIASFGRAAPAEAGDVPGQPARKLETIDTEDGIVARVVLHG